MKNKKTFKDCRDFKCDDEGEPSIVREIAIGAFFISIIVFFVVSLDLIWEVLV